MGDRDEVLSNCRLAQEVLCNCTEIDAELKELQREIDVVAELLRKAVYENARIAQNQDEFNERNNRYWERHRKATERFNQLEEIKRERQAKSLSLGTFIRELESSPSVVEEFDERLWAVAVDTVTVTKDVKLHFRFKDGTEV